VMRVSANRSIDFVFAVMACPRGCSSRPPALTSNTPRTARCAEG
jgi:hypothetical protein